MRQVRLTLVSASPRRRELLAQLGIPFDVVPSDVAEYWKSSDPIELAILNARRKAERSCLYGDRSRLLLGADTIVVGAGRIFGKPIGEVSAERMLTYLSDRWHRVITGVHFVGPALDDAEPMIRIDGSAVSKVRFRKLSRKDLDEYLASGEWQGKAGAYAIQGQGGGLVREVDGDFSNIVGLPIDLIRDIIHGSFGYYRFL